MEKKLTRKSEKETLVPTIIADEFALYQQTQSLCNAVFNQQVDNILTELNQLDSSFVIEATQLIKQINLFLQLNKLYLFNAGALV